jgi:hypothetical protein
MTLEYYSLEKKTIGKTKTTEMAQKLKNLGGKIITEQPATWRGYGAAYPPPPTLPSSNISQKRRKKNRETEESNIRFPFPLPVPSGLRKLQNKPGYCNSCPTLCSEKKSTRVL